MNAYLISRTIGTIVLDQTTREGHESTMRVTDNPVESGAAVADHAVLEPAQITIEGLMVDWLAQGVNLVPGEIRSPRVGGLNFLDNLALPAPVQSFTSGTLLQQDNFLGASSSYPSVVSLVDRSRELAPWLPDFAPVRALDTSAGTRRVEQCYDNLRQVQKSGETIDIVTGSRSYTNMLLVSVAMNQRQDGSAIIDITARELFIVETQMVSGLQVQGGETNPAGANKSGRSGAQSSATVNKGNAQTTGSTVQQERSWTHAIVGTDVRSLLSNGARWSRTGAGAATGG